MPDVIKMLKNKVHKGHIIFLKVFYGAITLVSIGCEIQPVYFFIR